MFLEIFFYERKGLVNLIFFLKVIIIVMYIEFKYILICILNKDKLFELIFNLCIEVKMKLLICKGRLLLLYKIKLVLVLIKFSINNW